MKLKMRWWWVWSFTPEFIEKDCLWVLLLIFLLFLLFLITSFFLFLQLLTHVLFHRNKLASFDDDSIASPSRYSFMMIISSYWFICFASSFWSSSLSSGLSFDSLKRRTRFLIE
jgi:uncharacterized BrkB/YihY/UPF0761 family membrane protein